MPAHTIRILAESKTVDSKAFDSNTGDALSWWRGNDLRIEIALSDSGRFLVASDVGSITVAVKGFDQGPDDAPSMIAVIGSADCDAGFDAEKWHAKTNSLCVAEFTRIESALDAGQYRLIVSHDDGDGNRNTYLSSEILVIEDGHDSVSLSSPPVPGTEYRTREESDARYAQSSDFESHVTAATAQDSATATTIFNLGSEVDGIAAAQTSGRIAFQTLALLDADLAHDENALAEVTNDGTSTNNGTYIKVGATGAGSWLKSTNDVSGRVTIIENGDSGYTGFHWVLADVAGNIMASWDQAGRLQTEFGLDSITNDALAISPEMTGYSGFDFLVLDSDDKIISGTYAGGLDINSVFIPPVVTTIPSIGCWGDSTSNNTFEPALSVLTGGTVQEYGWPSEKSHEIAERFLVRTDTEDILIFWMGRNDDPDHMKARVTFQFERMLDNLPADQKWLVCPVLPTQSSDDLGTSNHTELADLRDSLGSVYGDRFVDLHRGLLTRYDYGGFELAASFVQPAVAAQVTITLNSTTGILSYAEGRGINPAPDQVYAEDPQFYLGDLGETGDLYEIDSVDSATQITVTCIAQSTTTGVTIANETEATGYDLKKRFIFKRDAENYLAAVPARSMRSDIIHPGERGNDLIADIFHKHLQRLGWL